MAPKRVNKTKPEILDEMAKRAKIENFKDMGRRLFPILKTDSIYDAQTALDAVAGYVKMELAIKEAKLKINDIPLDFSKEPKGKVTDVMNAIKVEVQNENAKDVAEFLELFSRTFSSYAMKVFLEKPMSEVKVDDIVAK